MWDLEGRRKAEAISLGGHNGQRGRETNGYMCRGPQLPTFSSQSTSSSHSWLPALLTTSRPKFTTRHLTEPCPVQVTDSAETAISTPMSPSTALGVACQQPGTQRILGFPEVPTVFSACASGKSLFLWHGVFPFQTFISSRPFIFT